MDYELGFTAVDVDIPNISSPSKYEHEGHFEVHVEELSTWFIEDQYLVERSSGTPVTDVSHSHSGCYSGSTGTTSINPMRVQTVPGVKMKRLTVKYIVEDTADLEPIYPDLIRWGDELGDIGYSLLDR